MLGSPGPAKVVRILVDLDESAILVLLPCELVAGLADSAESRLAVRPGRNADFSDDRDRELRRRSCARFATTNAAS